MPETALMDKLVALCKRRGFIFQSSEIYGGIGGFWDYGPLGVELKRNVKEAWWRDMVTGHDDTLVAVATVNGTRIVIVAILRRARADSVGADIVFRTEIAVAAVGAVLLRRVRACAGLRVARALVVACVGRGADHRIGADADAGLAGVGLCATVPVIARGAVVHRREHAGVVRAGIRRARVVVIAIGVGVAAVFNRAAADACSALTGVRGGARIAVIAGRAVGFGRSPTPE